MTHKVFIIKGYLSFLARRKKVLVRKTRQLSIFSFLLCMLFCFGAFPSLSYGGIDNKDNSSKTPSPPAKNSRQSPSTSHDSSPPKKRRIMLSEDTSPPKTTAPRASSSSPSPRAESSYSLTNIPRASTSTEATNEEAETSTSTFLQSHDPIVEDQSEQEHQEAEEGLKNVPLNIYLLKEQKESIDHPEHLQAVNYKFNGFPWQFISENKRRFLCIGPESTCSIKGQFYAKVNKDGDDIYVFQETRVRQIGWVEMLQQQAKTYQDLEQTQTTLDGSKKYKEPTGGVVFVKTKIKENGKSFDRFFAITWGTTGRFILNLEECDHNFGKHYAYNLLASNPEQHRARAFTEHSLDKKTLNSKQAKLSGQITLPRKIRAFVPKGLVVTKQGRPIGSFRGLHIGIKEKFAFATIGEKCRQALEMANQNYYTQGTPNYKDIDYYTPLENDDKIRQILTSGKLDEYSIEPPFEGEEDADNQIDIFKLTTSSTRREIEYKDFSSLAKDIEDYIEEHKYDPELLANLKKFKITGKNLINGYQVSNWRADQLLTASIHVNGETYWLEGGEVFKIDQKFIDQLNEALNDRFQKRSQLDQQPPLHLLTPFTNSDIDEKGLSETAYNARMQDVNFNEFILLDADPIIIDNDNGSTNSKVEPCDLLSNKGDIIHVKRWTHHSSSLVYLATQALSSATLLMTDHKFKDKFIDKIKVDSNRHKIKSVGAPNNKLINTAVELLENKEFTKTCRIVVAFIHKDPDITPAGLPFNAKLALYKALLAIEKLGFECIIINIVDEATSKHSKKDKKKINTTNKQYSKSSGVKKLADLSTENTVYRPLRQMTLFESLAPKQKDHSATSDTDSEQGNDANSNDGPSEQESDNVTSDEESENEGIDKLSDSSERSSLADRTWYTDDIVNALMNLYFDHLDIRYMHAINVEANGGDTFFQNLRERENQIRNRESATGERISQIIMSINLGAYNPEEQIAGNHWVGLYILRHPEDNGNTQIWYFDPLGGVIPQRLQALLRELYPNAEYPHIPIRFQQDGYNCGPWVIEIFRSLVAKGALPPEGLDINEARLIHTHDLDHHRNSRRVAASSSPTTNKDSSTSSKNATPIASTSNIAIITPSFNPSNSTASTSKSSASPKATAALLQPSPPSTPGAFSEL